MGARVRAMAMRMGVDTGGTFTDCVVLEGGKIKILKVFSAPDTARAILDGVQQLANHGRPASVDLIHGTTVGTNCLLERRGSRVALVTTAGFEDLIEIGRQARARLYDLDLERDPPLVPRARRWGLAERTAAGGATLRKPTPLEIRRLVDEVRRSRAEAVAVCLLFAFVNPANERTVSRALRRLGIPVSVSHEILPEFREYERLSTTAINAYLAPRLGEYLARLERAVREGLCLSGGPRRQSRKVAGPSPYLSSGRVFVMQSSGRITTAEKAGREPVRTGLPLSGGPRRQSRRVLGPPPYPSSGRVFVMQSSGGITTAERAGREPVRTILSGPAGGVVATRWLADRLGIQRAISFDMGGTSTDVCLLDGPARTTHETRLGGLPVAVPVLDVHSVGAGGGSIARIDRGAALRAGPESAGATPGPICYGRGGVRPTVTDAHLLLGRLDPDHFLGGSFRLDSRAAEKGFVDFLRLEARKLGGAKTGFQTPFDLARGIVRVSEATLERALRLISVERGHDPRDFSLVCFGGAGGLHAFELARSLGLARVIVPPSPGAFSALGILLSDIVKDVSQSVLLPVPDVEADLRRPAGGPGQAARPAFRMFSRDLESRFARLERKAFDELRREGFRAAGAHVERRLDLRYAGQSYELSVPFAPNFARRFHAEHERAYGYAQPGRRVEVVNLRLRVAIPTRKPRLKAHALRIAGAPPALLEEKPVWFGRRYWRTAIYDRERLVPGARLMGPAVVVEYSSTTILPPDSSGRVDEYCNLILSRRGP